MLVLTRKIGEQTVIHDNIRITVLAVKGERVVLGFDAEPTVSILRAELAERIAQEEAAKAKRLAAGVN